MKKRNHLGRDKLRPTK